MKIYLRETSLQIYSWVQKSGFKIPINKRKICVSMSRRDPYFTQKIGISMPVLKKKEKVFLQMNMRNSYFIHKNRDLKTRIKKNNKD